MEPLRGLFDKGGKRGFVWQVHQKHVLYLILGDLAKQEDQLADDTVEVLHVEHTLAKPVGEPKAAELAPMVQLVASADAIGGDSMRCVFRRNRGEGIADKCKRDDDRDEDELAGKEQDDAEEKDDDRDGGVVLTVALLVWTIRRFPDD